MKKQTLTIARWIGVLVLYTLLSFLLMEILRRNGVYPTGSDTYYHIYQSFESKDAPRNWKNTLHVRSSGDGLIKTFFESVF